MKEKNENKRLKTMIHDNTPISLNIAPQTISLLISRQLVMDSGKTSSRLPQAASGGGFQQNFIKWVYVVDGNRVLLMK